MLRDCSLSKVSVNSGKNKNEVKISVHAENQGISMMVSFFLTFPFLIWQSKLILLTFISHKVNIFESLWGKTWKWMYLINLVVYEAMECGMGTEYVPFEAVQVQIPIDTDTKNVSCDFIGEDLSIWK